MVETNFKLVSIIVPIYNVEEYLHQCIDSILSQTYTYFELILVNDGSPDNCPEICEQYAQKDCRVRVVHKKNGGLSSAVLAGIEIAKGDFFYFVDSDDWIEPNALNKLCTVQRNNDYDLVVTSIFQNYQSSQIKKDNFFIRAGKYDKLNIKNELLPILLLYPYKTTPSVAPSRCGKLFKRAVILKNIHFYHQDISRGEDWFITIPYLLSIESMYLVPQSYDYHYRSNLQSLMHTINPRVAEDTALFIKYLQDVLNKLAHGKKHLLEQLDTLAIIFALSHVRQLEKNINNQFYSETIKQIKYLVSQSYVKREANTKNFSIAMRILLNCVKKRRHKTLYCCIHLFKIYSFFKKIYQLRNYKQS